MNPESHRSRTRAPRAAPVLAAACALALGAAASAQPLAGTYRGATDVGPAVVVFEQDGAALTGTLEAPGLAFAFDGEVEDGVGFGQVRTGQGVAGFEAHVQGDLLGLYLYEFDAAGGVAEGSVIELVLERVAASAPAAPALGGLRPGAAAAPPPSRGAPSTASPAPAPTDASPVLAVGAYGQLTEDAAHAFLEALEFVLAQIGAPYVFPEAERRAALEELARSFPLADPDEQRVLADARFVWTQVQANWANATLDEQREFALGVLALAFGEEAVQAWVGTSASAGASAGDGCSGFDECAGRYVDGQTWSDTFNAQSCWAAAGCSSFDASTGTFEYD